MDRLAGTMITVQSVNTMPAIGGNRWEAQAVSAISRQNKETWIEQEHMSQLPSSYTARWGV